MNEPDDLFPLDQLIRAYLHQDMELDAPTVPEALACYERLNDERTKDDLRSAMDRFLHRHHNDLHGAFERRYGFDFMPDELGLDVPGFFTLVRSILSDPARRIDHASGSAPSGARP
jgi:hypothetical protein